MKTTGYQLREAIKRWETRRDAAAAQFSEALWRFKDEDKLSPDDIMGIFTKAEDAVGRLQTVQSKYNLLVQVTVQGREMSLTEAVKLVGGAGRAEKMWREASTSTGRSLYDGSSRTVKKQDEEHAVRVLALPALLERSTKAARYTSVLKAAIAEANAREADIKDLDSALLTE
jgi:hypothetical protein